MKAMQVTSIGAVEISGSEMYIALDAPYVPALNGLEGFSHLNILWWFNGCDTGRSRQTLVTPVPYRDGDKMGVYATRSPERPNPVALTVARILHIDHESGKILVSYIDADHMSPVIDLKPYTPSMDRVENPGVPDWCAHWPGSLDASADFDWASEFNHC